MLLYAAPEGLRGVWGLAPVGARQYLDAAGLSIAVAPMARDTFVWAFRSLQVLSWLAWLAVVALVFGGARVRYRTALAVVAGAAATLAIIGPPVLSTDALAYVSYGRIFYAHGLNPYLHGQEALAAAGDPTAAFLFAPVLMPYGPLWPLFIAVLGSIASLTGLFGEILVHKLLAAAALVAAAAAASRAAEALTPGRGVLSLIAIGLNPLLLVEAAVGGHNDILPVALVMIAAALSIADRQRGAAVALGLAIATKTTAVGALPLLLLDRWVHASPASRVREIAVASVLALGPVLLLSLVFGGPTVVFGAVGDRLGLTGPSGAAAWLARALVGAAFAYGTWIVWRSGSARGTWMTAWVVAAAAIVFAGTTLRFPWYLAWPLVPALAHWDERHRILITGVVVCSVMASWLYTVGP
jgi:hypothetical protein